MKTSLTNPLPYLLIGTTGCASVSMPNVESYTGPNPNFNVKTDEERRAEISKFTIAGNNANEMGGTLYKAETVRPVIRSVSPNANDKLEHADRMETLSGILVFGGLLGFGGGFSLQNKDPWRVAGSALVLSGIGIYIYSATETTSAISQYNYDLRMKFAAPQGNNPVGATPELALSARF